eukprot:gene10353-19054_t
MDIYLDDMDVQRIKCEMQNNGKSSAAFELFRCLQSADDASFKELLAFLQKNKATKSVYIAISNECTKSGLQSILPRERNVSGEICEKSEKDLPYESMKASNRVEDQYQPLKSEKGEYQTVAGSGNVKSPIQEKGTDTQEVKNSQNFCGGETEAPVKRFCESRKDMKKGYDDRDGSEVDEKNLKEVFKWLGFDVKIHRNKKALEMWNILSEWSKSNHSQYDSFVTCILSHGKQDINTNKDEICGVDGKSFPVDDMIQAFNGENCSSLIDKPKLFFLQCCRGIFTDKGMPEQNNIVSDGLQEQHQAKVPMLCDVFIGYSTPPGFKSWRNTTEGSWYISKLCEVFADLAKDFDLMTMITKVNDEVSKFYTDEGFKQVPNPSMTLRKLLFFNPIHGR